MNARQQLTEPPANPVAASAPAMADRPLAEIVELAQGLQERGDVGAADQLYTQWLDNARGPGRHIALFNHGAILQATGQTARALEAYQEALRLEPGFGQACVNLGLLLERLLGAGHAEVDEAVHGPAFSACSPGSASPGPASSPSARWPGRCAAR